MATTTTMCLLVIIAVGPLNCDAAALSEEKVYSDKYDNINVDDILKNERKRENYYNCFIGKAPCITPDARFFKERFPEAMVTKCVKCTQKQSQNFEKIIDYYIKNEPAKWEAVLVKAISDYRKKNTA
ncbi:hypothetical protein QAD02_001670 [Eretmocerus hayati]|uniref:Uncharacterized protein n=1 Tax=Eretmocerus hayati TaxID=131215 RepID=A0ACC2NHL3_9HYME|nr:hypothetical protein QAD02_001670 [Eretmocerus hayati]